MTFAMAGRSAIAASLVFLFAFTALAGSKDPNATADHSKFEALKQPFASGPEVTKACLTCHTEAAHQVMDTIHWTWDYKHTDPVSGEEQHLGKKNVLNSFCGNIASNEPRCTSCHAGYGWDSPNFDFAKQENVDCLVCHDTTGTYSKYPTKAGHPLYEPLTTPEGKTVNPPDLNKIAQNVGDSGRENCGACHFSGGGADGVKHGDLDSSLIKGDKHLDVHMGMDGENMGCADCHRASAHKWPGSRYDSLAADAKGTGKPGEQRAVASCQSCHGDTPHPVSIDGLKLNDHTDRIACQTCHIPEFARGGVATKTLWDWSTAGKTKDGKAFTELDEHGHPKYMSIKGSFEHGENVTPEYAFTNGKAIYSQVGQKIDPSKPVSINAFAGSHDDPESRIWPFKLMRGKQAYDPVQNILVFNHVYGPGDDSAFWTGLDWNKSIAAGMKAAGMDWSGKYDFVETEMWWPIAHMVAPAEDALACDDCHAKDGRLAKLAGFYMPGRDSTGWLDFLGLLALAVAAVGVVGHGLLRIVFVKRTSP